MRWIHFTAVLMAVFVLQANIATWINLFALISFAANLIVWLEAFDEDL